VRQGDLTSRLTCDGNINDDFDRNLIQNFKGSEKNFENLSAFSAFFERLLFKDLS